MLAYKGVCSCVDVLLFNVAKHRRMPAYSNLISQRLSRTVSVCHAWLALVMRSQPTERHVTWHVIALNMFPQIRAQYACVPALGTRVRFVTRMRADVSQEVATEFVTIGAAETLEPAWDACIP